MPPLFASKTKPSLTTCALCRGSGPLCQSHIVPEFFYKPVYGAKHRYCVVSTDTNKPQEIEQKGLKEPLLCAKCEGRFNTYETYVSSVFYSPNRQVKPLFGGQAAVQNVDYAGFRCFMLSLIWRMGESSLPMFQQVRLGPHGETIRQALLKNDPLSESQYPFFITEIQMNGVFREDYMLGAQRIRGESQIGYRFIISGRLFTMLISSQPPPPLLLPMLFRRTGELYTILLEMDRIPFFGTALQDASVAMRKRDEQRVAKGGP
jgi:hypothetical protein